MLFKKVVSVLVAVIITLSFTLSTVSAQEDFTMKPFDKAYVTFIFDDGRMPFTKEMAELFKEYNMPMSCAIIANRVQKDSELHKTLLDIQNNGGEILAHGYNHSPITSQELSQKNNGIYKLEDIERELGSCWKRLTNLGFNVNGMIQAGCGGDESSADFALVETVARKYYKYSNASGVSKQYTKGRTFMSWKTFNGVKDMINKAIENKEWIILSAHGYSEITSDAASEDTGAMRMILNYIQTKQGEIEVVTWNYIYNTFSEYSGPAIPTAEAMAFLTITDDDDAITLAKNAYVEKPVTQSKPSETASSITSSQTNSTTSENTSSVPETSQTQSTVTSFEETPTVQEDTQENLNQTPKKKNNGKVIAICAVAVALASIIAAVIIILKLK